MTLVNCVTAVDATGVVAASCVVATDGGGVLVVTEGAVVTTVEILVGTFSQICTVKPDTVT